MGRKVRLSEEGLEYRIAGWKRNTSPFSGLEDRKWSHFWPLLPNLYRLHANPEQKKLLFPEFVHNLHHHAGDSLYQLLCHLNCQARLGSSTCLTRSPILT